MSSRTNIHSHTCMHQQLRPAVIGMVLSQSEPVHNSSAATTLFVSAHVETPDEFKLENIENGIRNNRNSGRGGWVQIRGFGWGMYKYICKGKCESARFLDVLLFYSYVYNM